MATPGVDFFRVDRSDRTRFFLALAAVMIAGGASAVGAHLMHRFTPHAGHAISIAGGVVMLSGLVLGFGTMATMLFEDVYLVIRDSGLLVHDNGKDVEVAWDELAAVDLDLERGQVALRRTGGDSFVFHGGRSAAGIAARIEDAKRKATHGLLRTSTS